MVDLNEHWNHVFARKADPELGWYESEASKTREFLGMIPELEDATVFLPGAGTSVLVDELLAMECRLVLNDISDEALARLGERIGGDRENVIWLHHDISGPLPEGVPAADVWIDRAVLHFLLTEPEIDGYFANLDATVCAGGYALLAEFSTEGASRCAGLDVHRYSVGEMTQRLGPGFSLVAHAEHTHMTPSGGERPYVYALYRKDGSDHGAIGAATVSAGTAA